MLIVVGESTQQNNKIAFKWVRVNPLKFMWLNSCLMQ